MTVKFSQRPDTSTPSQSSALRIWLTTVTIMLFSLSIITVGNNLNIPHNNFTINSNEPPVLLFPLDTNFTEDSQLYLSHETILEAVYDPDHDDSLLTITITTDSGQVFYWFDQVGNSHKFWANKDVDSCGYFHIQVQDPLDSILIESFIVDIIPVNDAPVIIEIPDTNTVQDSTFYLPLDSYWSDVDNELSEVTWSISAIYSNVSITDTKDSLMCVPPSGFIGLDTLFLTLTDIEGLADRDTFGLFFCDAYPPGFTIGIFQNPVASEHLDIYFFPNESIDSLYSATINEDSVSTELLSGINPSPFHIHYRLQGNGVQQLRITASDTSGNIGITEYDFSSSYISKTNGGIIYSSDSVVQIIIASESVLADHYILCLPFVDNSQTDEINSELDLMEKTANLHDETYTFVSPYSDLANKCKVIFYRKDGEQQHGIFTWKQQRWVYLKTYSNANNTQYWTYTNELGSFALKPAAPEIAEKLPSHFSLAQNYPNPFNSETVISFNLPELSGSSVDAAALIIVYDILGRKVETVINQPLIPGRYSLRWNGSRLASGAYYYTIRYGQYIETKKMVLVK